MSLRFFHFVFILLSTALAGVCAVMGLSNYRQTGGSLDFLVGAGAIVLGLGFLVYGVWFLKKTRSLVS